MKKRIRLTIEWDGAAGESCWGSEVAKAIEACDRSKITKVVEVEHLTHYGETSVRKIPGAKRRPPFGGALWDWVTGPPSETGFR